MHFVRSILIRNELQKSHDMCFQISLTMSSNAYCQITLLTTFGCINIDVVDQFYNHWQHSACCLIRCLCPIFSCYARRHSISYYYFQDIFRNNNMLTYKAKNFFSFISHFEKNILVCSTEKHWNLLMPCFYLLCGHGVIDGVVL